MIRLGLLCLATLACAGTARAQYDHESVRFLSRVPLSSMPGSPSSGAGCTGYVSPSGREYAIMGVRNGTIVVEITNPTVPAIVGLIQGPSSLWHEVAVLGDFAYTATEGGGGMQIIDLRDVDGGQVSLAGTYTGGGLSNIHTIQSNPASGHLYLNGSNLGLVILDATQPTAPVQVARWTTRYVHDSYITTYDSGPYEGREIAFLSCGGAGLYIVDVTDKSNLATLSSLQYLPSNAYCHSGALTPDKRYFLVNDEFDERNGLTDACTTHIVDVLNLSNPLYVGEFTNGIPIIDHNSMMLGNHLMLAAYRGGLRVYDAANPLQMSETGRFDTYPSGYGFGYDGAWGVFAGFPSGNVIISDIQRGLFVVDPSEARGMGAVPLALATVRATLTSGDLQSIRSEDAASLKIRYMRSALSLLEISFGTTAGARTTFDLEIRARAPRGPISLRVLLLNRVDNRWEFVGSLDLARDFNVRRFEAIPGEAFVDSDGRIEMRLQGHPGSRDSGTEERRAIDVDYDLIRLIVR
jgi:choice-of-anchor B domain-containing protein